MPTELTIQLDGLAHKIAYPGELSGKTDLLQLMKEIVSRVTAATGKKLGQMKMRLLVPDANGVPVRLKSISQLTEPAKIPPITLDVRNEHNVVLRCNLSSKEKAVVKYSVPIDLLNRPLAEVKDALLAAFAFESNQAELSSAENAAAASLLTVDSSGNKTVILAASEVGKSTEIEIELPIPAPQVELTLEDLPDAAPLTVELPTGIADTAALALALRSAYLAAAPPESNSSSALTCPNDKLVVLVYDDDFSEWLMATPSAIAGGAKCRLKANIKQVEAPVVKQSAVEPKAQVASPPKPAPVVPVVAKPPSITITVQQSKEDKGTGITIPKPAAGTTGGAGVKALEEAIAANGIELPRGSLLLVWDSDFEEFARFNDIGDLDNGSRILIQKPAAAAVPVASQPAAAKPLGSQPAATLVPQKLPVPPLKDAKALGAGRQSQQLMQISIVGSKSVVNTAVTIDRIWSIQRCTTAVFEACRDSLPGELRGHHGEEVLVYDQDFDEYVRLLDADTLMKATKVQLRTSAKKGVGELPMIRPKEGHSLVVDGPDGSCSVKVSIDDRENMDAIASTVAKAYAAAMGTPVCREPSLMYFDADFQMFARIADVKSLRSQTNVKLEDANDRADRDDVKRRRGEARLDYVDPVGGGDIDVLPPEDPAMDPPELPDFVPRKTEICLGIITRLGSRTEDGMHRVLDTEGDMYKFSSDAFFGDDSDLVVCDAVEFDDNGVYNGHRVATNVSTTTAERGETALQTLLTNHATIHDIDGDTVRLQDTKTGMIINCQRQWIGDYDKKLEVHDEFLYRMPPGDVSTALVARRAEPPAPVLMEEIEQQATIASAHGTPKYPDATAEESPHPLEKPSWASGMGYEEPIEQPEADNRFIHLRHQHGDPTERAFVHRAATNMLKFITDMSGNEWVCPQGCCEDFEELKVGDGVKFVRPEDGDQIRFMEKQDETTIVNIKDLLTETGLIVPPLRADGETRIKCIDSGYIYVFRSDESITPFETLKAGNRCRFRGHHVNGKRVARFLVRLYQGE